ncbi:MAG: MinD/ParA family protein [candidate division FCPU426 bacterium]
MADQAEKLRDLARQVRLSTGRGKAPARARGSHRQGRARVIAVSSGKGGVGKTNLSINLALSLCKAGKKVLLFDADLGLANADVLLGMSSRHNLSHFFQGERSLEEITATGPLGLKVIASGSGISQMADLNGQDRERLLGHLSGIEDHVDMVIVDTGAGISKNVMAFAMAADECLVVTTPEPTARLDAYGLLKVLSQEGYDGTSRLVVNMAENEAEGAEIGGLMETLARRYLKIRLEYLGYVPRDKAVRKAVGIQQPFALSFPDSQAAKAVQGLATRLLEAVPADGNGGIQGFLERLGGMLKGKRGAV